MVYSNVGTSLCCIIGLLVSIFTQNTVKSQNSCLQTGGENGLPFFRGYHEDGDGNPDRRIYHQHQAIIPSYKFNCCGNITEWGVDLNPDTERGTFDFIFQVRRPSSTVNTSGCYSLVDDFISSSISVTTSEPVARVVPSPQDQLQFQPGDVLGFYVERHGGESSYNDGVVLLIDSSHTSESVWHASIDITAAQTSQSSGSCPYPIGTNGVLDTLTHAAPVISVSSITTPCSNTLLAITTSSSFFPNYPTSTNLPATVVTTSHSYIPVTTIATSPSPSPSPTDLAPTEVDYMSVTSNEDPSSSRPLSTIQVVGISVISVSVVVLIIAVAMSVLCCVKHCRKNIPLSPNDGDLRCEQSNNTGLTYQPDYPDVLIASMKLNDNQAYGNFNSRATHGNNNTTDDAFISCSSSIELKGNDAYAAFDLLS